MKKEREDYLNRIELVMKLSGLWTDYTFLGKFGTLVKYLQISRLLFTIGVWLLPIYKFSEKGFTLMLDESIVLVSLGFNCIMVGSWTALNSRKIQDATKTFRGIHAMHKEPWEIELLDDVYTQFHRYISINFRILISSITAYLVLPIIIDLFLAAWNYPPYKFPDLLDVYLENPTTKRDFHYWSVILASKVWVVFLAAAYIGFERTLLYIIVFYVGEFRIFAKRIELIVEQGEKSECDLVRDWDLSKAVTNHQNILRLITTKMNWVWFPVFLQTWYAVISICMVLHVMNQALIKKDIVLVAFAGSFLLTLVLLIFTFCAGGQILEYESEQMFNALREMTWYQQRPKVRKAMIMMTRQAARLHGIKYKTQYLNLATFLKVIQNAYSFFTLIKSSERRI